MLTFEFIANVAEDEPGMSQFSQGQIIVRGNDGVCAPRSLQDTTMLILDVCELLAGLYLYFTRNWDKQHVFSTMYGNYGFKVFKLKSGVMRLSCGSRDKVFALTTAEELRSAVWDATRRLYTQYASTFDAVVPAQGDMAETEASGLKYFEDVLNKWQSAFPELPPYR